MNILIVDDMRIVAEAIGTVFSRLPSVNNIHYSYSFDDARSKVMSSVYDVVLVDINLGHSDLNGLDLCELIRNAHPDVRIVVITAINSLSFLERAFDLGVEDYITKPFHPKELELRVKRWFFRSESPRKQSLLYHGLSHDPENNEFYFHGDKLSLTKRNKLLLLLFLQSPERLLTYTYIREKFWGDYDHRRSRNLRSNIQGLRRSLRDCGNWVKTVRGEGYILKKV